MNRLESHSTGKASIKSNIAEEMKSDHLQNNQSFWMNDSKEAIDAGYSIRSNIKAGMVFEYWVIRPRLNLDIQVEILLGTKFN